MKIRPSFAVIDQYVNRLRSYRRHYFHQTKQIAVMYTACGLTVHLSKRSAARGPAVSHARTHAPGLSLQSSWPYSRAHRQAETNRIIGSDPGVRGDSAKPVRQIRAKKGFFPQVPRTGDAQECPAVVCLRILPLESEHERPVLVGASHTTWSSTEEY